MSLAFLIRLQIVASIVAAAGLLFGAGIAAPGHRKCRGPGDVLAPSPCLRRSRHDPHALHRRQAVARAVARDLVPPLGRELQDRAPRRPRSGRLPVRVLTHEPGEGPVDRRSFPDLDGSRTEEKWTSNPLCTRDRQEQEDSKRQGRQTVLFPIRGHSIAVP